MNNIEQRVERQLGRARLNILSAYTQNAVEMYKAAELVLDDYNRFPDKPLVLNLVLTMVKTIVQTSGWQPIERAGKAYDMLLQLDLEQNEFEFIRKTLIDEGELERPGIRIVRMKV